MSQLQHLKIEKVKLHHGNRLEGDRLEGLDVVSKLMKEKEDSHLTISSLKEELEKTKKTYEEQCSLLERKNEELKITEKNYKQKCLQLEEQAQESEGFNTILEGELIERACLAAESINLDKKVDESSEEKYLQLEKQAKESEDSKLALQQRLQEVEYLLTESRKTSKEIETVDKYEERCLQLEKQGTESEDSKLELIERLEKTKFLLTESSIRNKELEAFFASNTFAWSRKEQCYQNFISSLLQELQELRLSSASIKRDIINAQGDWKHDCIILGKAFEEIANAIENHHIVLSENQRLYNEIQDLKGKIRVYCRIRPSLPGQTGKQSTIEYVGDDGEMVIANPSRQGREGRRMFKFDKIFGPGASQEEVYMDTQPLVRCVLDGYNVCIFAYGQTGSGKTYTMSGEDASIEEAWGVNYRALNDLFCLSLSRKSSFNYEVGVQMVEIYNEEVRDLLGNDGTQKSLGIFNSSQPNGLAVPDASMHPVNSMTDVLELMHTGQVNRTVGSTALNIRSSRSHSVLSVHVCGTNLEIGDSLRGSLHLVDLAGSERADRSGASGDRLKESQHINKSLSALGDVISALAQKSPHVPYRNSKLTRILQSSLGGQAKTLMFVHLNPDLESYSETLSSLKFAERVSGIELGASRSHREGKDIKELIDQVAALKDKIAKKDEEIEKLQVLKDRKTQTSGVKGEKYVSRLKHTSSLSPPSSSGTHYKGSTPIERGNSMVKPTSIQDNQSDHGDKLSEFDSQESKDDVKSEKEDLAQSKTTSEDLEERLSDTSDSGILSVGAETNASMETLSVGVKAAETTEQKSKASSRPVRKPGRSASTRMRTLVPSKGVANTSKAATASASSSPGRSSTKQSQ